MLTPTDQAVQQDPSEERKRKRKEYRAKYRRAAKEDAARVVELEAKGLGQLTEEEKKELAELQPRVAARKQQRRKRTRGIEGWEGRMLPVLWSWRSWRGGGR
ncbi:hypothetical protein [Saccharopolyspora spinosa]|uniref:hypothetical protein n=1 Tax=Saccharopolyspora spinosa TaxID=60894 RepID=UPI00376F295D